MMAKMRMANMTRSAICMSGASALKMDFSTTCRPAVFRGKERKKPVRTWNQTNPTIHWRSLNACHSFKDLNMY